MDDKATKALLQAQGSTVGTPVHYPVPEVMPSLPCSHAFLLEFQAANNYTVSACSCPFDIQGKTTSPASARTARLQTL